MEGPPTDAEARITRRHALALGGAGLGLLAAGCATSPNASGAGPGGSGAGPCVLTAESTEGPFFLDDELVRRDITDGRPGSPLRLRLTVVGAGSCNPIAGAAVDIWHCDAAGDYSGFVAASRRGPSDSMRFLRGVQVTDARGTVEFVTVYPGWYQRRAVHIHTKVTEGAEHTGQIYFPDELTDAVHAADPYRSRGRRDMRNAQDSIFRGSEANVVAIAPDGAGHAASITLAVNR